MINVILNLYLKEMNKVSWECYTLLKCKDCGLEYTIENSTLTINIGEYEKCPKCNSNNVIIVSTNSMLDSMNKQKELFGKRKKRYNL